jgi:transcriptional regulator with XRE-family HTH domain
MATLKELRLQADYSKSKLARLAGIDHQTITRAEQGTPVQDAKAYAILRILSSKLEKDITFKDVEGLNIIGEERWKDKQN